jgi:hypothetical protein
MPCIPKPCNLNLGCVDPGFLERFDKRGKIGSADSGASRARKAEEKNVAAGLVEGCMGWWEVLVWSRKRTTQVCRMSSHRVQVHGYVGRQWLCENGSEGCVCEAVDAREN